MIPPFVRPPHATRHCRHYSYSMEMTAALVSRGPSCAAGLGLSEPGASRKCMPDAQPPTCSLRQEYTDDERAAWKAACEASSVRLIAAIAALPRAIPLRTGGFVPCPSCGGLIRYDRWHRGASLACSTEGCCGARFNIAAGADWPARSKEGTEA